MEVSGQLNLKGAYHAVLKPCKIKYIHVIYYHWHTKEKLFMKYEIYCSTYFTYPEVKRLGL